MHQCIFTLQRKSKYKWKHDELQCSLCGLQCTSDSARKLHTEECQEKMKCESCDIKAAMFDKIRNFHVHIRHCRNGKPFSFCPVCDKTDFKSATNTPLEKVVTDHFSHCKKKGPTCYRCNKIFDSREKFRKHVKEKHHDFPCEKCGAFFYKKEKLQEHMQREHHE